MKTDDLVDMLARGMTAPEPIHPSARITAAIAWGIAGAALGMALLLGVRKDLVEAAALSMFWVKVFLPGSLAVIAFYAVRRLAIPGLSSARALSLLGLPIALVSVLGLASYASATAGERSGLLWGDTWYLCLICVPLLSVPLLVALFRVLKELAPTRPMVTGAVAGLLAGAVSAAIYALHCPELAPPFIAVWYSLGMATTALAGAFAGHYLLRW
jgi:hypothetical protein